jgi:hypothetical protein
VTSLQNRTPEELAERAAEVKSHPKVARLVLPEVLKSLRDSKSEQQLCSAIRVLRVFLDQRQVEKALFRLRYDGRENVAAAAVEALGHLRPAEHAADVLGRCLGDMETVPVMDAVIDEVCAGLFRLGEAGRSQMEQRLPLLSVERRVWLVGYVMEWGRNGGRPWLEMLLLDDDIHVRSAAEEALRSMSRASDARA